MDEQWLAEQPVEPDAEPRPRVTWEDVWGGLGAGKASDGNLALAFEDIDADEWGFAVGTSAAEDRSGDSGEPARVALADDEALDGWEIPALGSFDAVVDPSPAVYEAVVDHSPAYDEDVDRGGPGPADDLGGFDLDALADDEPSGPLAFSTPSAPPAWRPGPDEPEPDSPPEVSSPPAMDAPSVRAQAAPAPVFAPAAATAASAPQPVDEAPVAVAVAPAPTPAPAPAPATRRSVEDLFGDDLFDDDSDEDDEDDEPRGAVADPFAGAADLPERWTYSSRRKLVRRRGRSERNRASHPRKGRRRQRRSTFKEVPFGPEEAPIGDEEAHAPARRTPDDRGPGGRTSEDRAPAGRGRRRRAGRHRRGLVDVKDAPPRRTRRLRSAIVRVLGVTVPVAAGVIAYLRLS
jgi:hypothetical protein